jgi:hypothetical protein
MAGDAVFAFFEVVVCLVIAIAVLWLVAKTLGYLASLFDGEPLIPTIRADIESTRREARTILGRRPKRRSKQRTGQDLPTAG